jgi:hypothetical protein
MCVWFRSAQSSFSIHSTHIDYTEGHWVRRDVDKAPLLWESGTDMYDTDMDPLQWPSQGSPLKIQGEALEGCDIGRVV